KLCRQIEYPLLKRMLQFPVAIERPSFCLAGSEHSGMFPRTVVVNLHRLVMRADQILHHRTIARLVRTATKIRFSQTNLREDRCNSLQMIARAAMTCAANRKLGIGEAEAIGSTAEYNRQRLDHLDR